MAGDPDALPEGRKYGSITLSPDDIAAEKARLEAKRTPGQSGDMWKGLVPRKGATQLPQSPLPLYGPEHKQRLITEPPKPFRGQEQPKIVDRLVAIATLKASGIGHPTEEQIKGKMGLQTDMPRVPYSSIKPIEGEHWPGIGRDKPHNQGITPEPESKTRIAKDLALKLVQRFLKIPGLSHIMDKEGHERIMAEINKGNILRAADEIADFVIGNAVPFGDGMLEVSRDIKRQRDAAEAQRDIEVKSEPIDERRPTELSSLTPHRGAHRSAISHHPTPDQKHEPRPMTLAESAPKPQFYQSRPPELTR